MTRVQGQPNTIGDTGNEQSSLVSAFVVAPAGWGVQRSTLTNPAGIDWLRHCESNRVREVNFREGALAPIDAAFVPLRPGMALNNRERVPAPKDAGI